jgi:DNA-binding NtrC family response regulator
VYERGALESLGIDFTLALSTNEALEVLSRRRFDAIISDMGRREGPREGYVLLDGIRKSGAETPFFIYAGSNAPEHKHEATSRGAQGSTNRATELFDIVAEALH